MRRDQHSDRRLRHSMLSRLIKSVALGAQKLQFIPQCKPRRSKKAPKRAASKASVAARTLILTIMQAQCRSTLWIGRMHTRTTDLNRFPFSNFKYFLTLFSKFFSSFPHGTCSLSVSHQYLALDGIYHPLRAAVPNNSTRRKRTVRVEDRHERGYHPPRRSVPRDLTRLRPLVSLLQTTIPKIFSLSFSRFSRPY